MKISTFLILVCILIPKILYSQNSQVELIRDEQGMKLLVEGENFMVNGMNWDYFPRGTNFDYSLWEQSDEFIMQALEDEMSLLKDMGVNSVRIYTGIPPRWITYIYRNFGIYTMLNHAFGRYGLDLKDGWMENTEYSDRRVRKKLLKEVVEMVKEYQGTEGLLLYLLGNENNYGLFWEGAETEDIPEESEESIIRATAMYKLFNEATVAMKKN